MKAPIERERNRKKNSLLYAIIGGIVYIYAVLVYLQYGAIRAVDKRISTFDAINTAMTYVFTKPSLLVGTTKNTLTLLFSLSIMAGAVLVIVMMERNLRRHDDPTTVNGEARMMTMEDLKEYNKKFSSPLGSVENEGENNMIISKEIRLAIDNRGTRRNCNILVIGGSGAGKSRFFASPNILQYNCNFVITDPSGEMLNDYGKALEDNGYEVKVFNLVETHRSNRYNPFHYIKDEKDVFTLVNCLIKNTTPAEAGKGDPFWEKSENLLLTALILYLWHTAPPAEQTFANVLKLIDMAEIDENDASAESQLDMLFEALRNEDPENLAVKQYRKFKTGAGKTLKSIIISVNVRLQAFDLSNIKFLTATDDFEFERFADTKQALFVIIPTADDTFNFLVSLLYSQLFSSLYEYAETRAEFGWKASIDDLTNIKVVQAKNSKDSARAEREIKRFVGEIKKYGVVVKKDKAKQLYKVYTKKTKQLIGWRGSKEQTKAFIEKLNHVKISKCSRRCPNHVRLILDEFANIGQIPTFDQKLATMRKYEISCSIILQAISQLKDIYKDKWNTIMGNCDTKLFLGSDDTETIKWMVEVLGKKTTVVENTSYAEKGHGSTSYNRSSIELMTIDQVAMMADDECLVRIRGVHPYYGKKFELTQHKNYPEAHAKAGKFVIPLAKGAEKISNGPLSQRKKGLATATAFSSETSNSDAKSKDPSSKNSKTKEEQKAKMAVDNKARKIKADELQKEKDEKANDPNVVDQEALMNDLISSFGISGDVSDEKIKEAVESVLLMQDVDDVALSFKAT